MIQYPQLRHQPTYKAILYQDDRENKILRKWFKQLNKQNILAILEDIKTLELRWPIGLPLVKKINPKLWELRSRLNRQTVRIIFTIDKENKRIVLLHGFVKKTNKLPTNLIKLALKRKIKYEKNLLSSKYRLHP